jgi:hypothetical protein
MKHGLHLAIISDEEIDTGRLVLMARQFLVKHYGRQTIR